MRPTRQIRHAETVLQTPPRQTLAIDPLQLLGLKDPTSSLCRKQTETNRARLAGWNLQTSVRSVRLRLSFEISGNRHRLPRGKTSIAARAWSHSITLLLTPPLFCPACPDPQSRNENVGLGLGGGPAQTPNLATKTWVWIGSNFRLYTPAPLSRTTNLPMPSNLSGPRSM